jgi:hypothetical protein
MVLVNASIACTVGVVVLSYITCMQKSDVSLQLMMREIIVVSILPLCQNVVSHKFFLKSKTINFEQVYRKVHPHLQYVGYGSIYFMMILKIFIRCCRCSYFFLYTWSKFIKFDFHGNQCALHFGIEGALYHSM